MPRFVDTHCHIDLFPDYNGLIRQVEAAKIYTIAVTNAPSVFRQSNLLTKNTKYLRTALGLHPELAYQRSQEIALFDELVTETRYVGEIGLDFVTTSQEERRVQRHVFEHVICTCARLKDKVLTIHSRRAAKEVVEIIGDSFPGSVILHWYSGNRKVLDQALSFGFYFSINSAMLNSKSGREVCNAIPSDRILTESDGPFVSSLSGASTPLNMSTIVRELAQLRKVEEDAFAAKVFHNFEGILAD